MEDIVDIEESLESFYTISIANGISVALCYDKIVAANEAIFSKHCISKVVANVPKHADNVEQKLEVIRKNVCTFQDHLEEKAAYLYYAVPISHRQLEKVDRVLHCQKRSFKTLNDMLEKLPTYTTIKSLLGQLYNENNLVTEYVISTRSEPNFPALGLKYELVGRKGGKKLLGLELKQSFLLV